jgi:hypothetical protein
MKKRDGFLYILRHQDRVFQNYCLRDEEHLFKIGVTTRTVKIRLKQHNTDFSKAAGMIVQETGKLWDLYEVYSVQDVYLAENLFWKNSPFADIPFMGGVEICAMKPEHVQKALEALIRFSYGTIKLDVTNT